LLFGNGSKTWSSAPVIVGMGKSRGILALLLDRRLFVLLTQAATGMLPVEALNKSKCFTTAKFREAARGDGAEMPPKSPQQAKDADRFDWPPPSLPRSSLDSALLPCHFWYLIRQQMLPRCFRNGQF
jgi:hypothetical protein